MLKLSLTLVFVFLSLNSFANDKDLIPINIFAQLPAVSGPELSADGEHIIAISPIDGEEMVVVSKFGSIEFTPVVKLKKEQNRIEYVSWLTNKRVLVYTSYNELIYNKRWKISRLYAVNIDGSEVKQLVLPELIQHKYSKHIRVISTLPDDQEHILVQAYTNVDNTPAVFKMNINDSSVEKIISATEEIDSWVPDSKGNIYIGVKYDYDKNKDENIVEIYFRENVNSNEWEKIYSYASLKEFYLQPIRYYKDKNALLVFTDYESDKSVLRYFDVATKAFAETVFELTDYDLERAYFEEDEFVGVGYTDDYYQVKYIDEKLSSLQQSLQKTFAKYQSYIYSSSKDKNRLIVSASTTNSPAKFFLVDLAAKKVSFWLSQYAQLEKKNLPSKQKFNYLAKDGQKMVGYLTPGSNGAKSPLVVFPHGGPASRDDMHFDIWVQMLARRGYAVLQMNFRGSDGYGNSFDKAGYKQWGKLMQTDVYDAIEWVKNNKLADTSNKCLVGWSYGGYVALTAGFQQPKEFNCVISGAGLSDLPAMVKTDNFWSDSSVTSDITVGDITKTEDLKQLRENSAIFNVEKFDSPLLLIHGTNDQIVKIAQSEDLYKALKKRKKSVEFLKLEDGTHNLDSPKNREVAFVAIDKFLAKYLK
jgi:dipeptidyl aminopeptidase/acylaminoacyl peptidase